MSSPLLSHCADYAIPVSITIIIITIITRTRLTCCTMSGKVYLVGQYILCFYGKPTALPFHSIKSWIIPGEGLRHRAARRKVAGSFHGRVIGIFKLLRS